MSDHPDPDRLLEDLATGELPPDDPRVVSLRATDAEFDAAVRELEVLRGALDESAAIDRELVEGAIEGTSPEDRRLVQESLDAALRRPAPRITLLKRLSLVAAAALVAFVWFQSRGVENPDDGTLLGGDSRILEPHGRVEAFERVRLDYDALASARSVRTTVLAADDGEVLFERDELGTGTWILSEADRTKWNEEGAVRVRVEVVYRSGEEEELSAKASSR